MATTKAIPGNPYDDGGQTIKGVEIGFGPQAKYTYGNPVLSGSGIQGTDNEWTTDGEFTYLTGSNFVNDDYDHD